MEGAGAAADGIPARSSMARTFVLESSYWSEKPTTSNSRTDRWVSSVRRGRRSRRIASSMSIQGMKQRSAATPGIALSRP
jgi:hypothetical protein